MPVDYYCHYFNYLQFCPLIWKRLSVQPFTNATFTAFNADIQTDTLSSNYELCSGVSVAVGRELVHWKRKNNLFCSYSPWCMYLALLLFSFPPFFCVPLCTSLRTSVACWRQMVRPKNGAGWLIPAEIGLHLALSPSVNSTASDS